MLPRHVIVGGPLFGLTMTVSVASAKRPPLLATRTLKNAVVAPQAAARFAATVEIANRDRCWSVIRRKVDVWCEATSS
jgi:hypothetical protein